MAFKHMSSIRADDEIVTLHFEVRSLNILKLKVETLDEGRKTDVQFGPCKTKT